MRTSMIAVACATALLDACGGDGGGDGRVRLRRHRAQRVLRQRSVRRPESITTPSFNTRVVRTFPAKGRYVYNCHIHPGMSGVIVVQ